MLILGGVGKAKGADFSNPEKSPIDFFTSHRCTKYYLILFSSCMQTISNINKRIIPTQL